MADTKAYDPSKELDYVLNEVKFRNTLKRPGLVKNPKIKALRASKPATGFMKIKKIAKI